MATEPAFAIVCAACGKVQGEHHGWDESCSMHAVEVHTTSIIRDSPGGRVMRASATGRELSIEERWPSSSTTPNGVDTKR